MASAQRKARKIAFCLDEWNILYNFALFFVNMRQYQVLGKFTEYKIPLMSMPEGEHRYDFHLDRQFFANMENADICDADLDVALTVVHKGDLYNFSFKIDGTITLICDRCLDSLIWPVDTYYNIGVKYGDSYNDESDDLLIIPSSDSYLNVAYMIHDTVALTIPIKHVHPAGKCNSQMSAVLKKHRAPAADDEDFGSEEAFGDEADNSPEIGETPTDPRWDALRNFAPESSEDN